MAKKYRKIQTYVAVFEPDTKVGGYTVTIPSLPGCISEGDTFEEALKNIKEAAELYLEVMGSKKKLPQNAESIIVAPIGVSIQ